MNKLELIAELAGKQWFSKQESARIVDLFFDAMTCELCNGGRVEIRGLCTFHVKKYPGYTGRNPKSGEPVTVKGKKLPLLPKKINMGSGSYQHKSGQKTTRVFVYIKSSNEVFFYQVFHA